MLCIFFTLLRTVLKLVSMPPNQRSVTKGMFTLFAHSVTISFACFLVPTNMIFLPERAICFITAAFSWRHSVVLFRSIMLMPFFSAKMYGNIFGFHFFLR